MAPPRCARTRSPSPTPNPPNPPRLPHHPGDNGDMARFRMYPTSEQASIMLEHCAHARYVWNLAVEQHSHWRKGRKAAPGFAEQCRQLTEARRENEWLGSGNDDVQQQAL